MYQWCSKKQVKVILSYNAPQPVRLTACWVHFFDNSSTQIDNPAEAFFPVHCPYLNLKRLLNFNY